MADAVTLRYADAGLMAAEIRKVRENNERVIQSVISRRLSNGLTTQQKTAALAKLMDQFKPNFDELDQINIRFAQKTQEGMDGFHALDQAGANAFR